MKVRDLMTKHVIQICPEETVAVAARMLDRYNIGSLPVCAADGRLCGVVTDRDLAVRCMAAEKNGTIHVSDVMTAQVVTVSPDMEAEAAAQVMGRRQIRRLPVVEAGKVCGMLSLADLASAENAEANTINALSGISSSLSSRK